MLPHLTDKLRSLPDSPGVYLMKNADGKVIYVGKAKSLRDRVRSYFSGSDTRAFVARLDTLLHDLEVVLTHSDKEAFLLENELIKQHSPRFNIKLTDDKRFLCLRLDTRKSSPRLEVVRRFGADGARYFGPYHSASSLRETLRIVNRHFQLRTCSDQMLANRVRPCLQYQIKRCPAPCVFDLSDGAYTQNVNNVIAFLEGRQSELLGHLNDRMAACAAQMEYEAAGALRDQIDAVKRSLERQRMVSTDLADRDVIGLYREGPAIEIHVMRTRGGRLMDARRYSFADTEVPTADVLGDFAGSYYSVADGIPHEILFPADMEWDSSLAAVLSERTGHTVKVLVPQRGDKHAMVVLAQRNAHQAFMDKQREAGAARTAIDLLQKHLRLSRPPVILECFDISHMQGSQIVASCVCLQDGVPRKDRYRHYKIRTVADQDDFKSMYEVIGRRARRGIEEGDLPDLLVIDGGKGQLGAARAALDDHGVDSVDLIGLAKSRSLDDADDFDSRGIDMPDATHHANVAPAPATAGSAARPGSKYDAPLAYSPERVFVHGQKNPIVLRQNSAELFILTRARDEAHRFAITFHRKLRGKAATRSSLDDVVGIGPKRRRLLLRTFGSLTRLRAASEADMAAVVGVKMAALLRAHFAAAEPEVAADKK
jgi:excinuclease ABC subunit C